MTKRKPAYQLPKKTPTQLQAVKAQRKQTTRKRKQPHQKLPLGFWFAAVLVVCVAFFFVLRLIGDPVEEPQTATETLTHAEFIQALVPHAQELQQQTKLLPSILLAQAILESDWGQSELGKKYYNLFGRKAFGDEEKVRLKTLEYENGEWIEIEADFKVYPDWNASMDDHAKLFTNGVSWDSELYRPVLAASDYQTAAQALQTAGYATDPNYAQKIIEVIETNQLAQYDK